MTTRGEPNALHEQRMVKSVTIIYNLCNEPWIKYSMILVADRGLTKPTFTSTRLKRGEVLYLENHSHRYELCFMREKTGSTSQAEDTEESKASMGDVDDNRVSVFRFSRCKKILSQETMLSYGVPLPVDLLEVMQDDLEWEDTQWSDTGVSVGGKEYNVVRMLFFTPTGVGSVL